MFIDWPKNYLERLGLEITECNGFVEVGMVNALK
jgi:hypothetical protein